jgi:ElaB/YqjD/DUF883 family membrane-anchored ribosome-binding protein
MTETTQNGRQRRETIDSHDVSQPTPNTITERVATSAHETVDRVARAAEQAEHNVREHAGDAAEMVRGAEQRLVDSASSGARRIKIYVHKHLLGTVSIAFAAGVVLSALLRK